MYGFSRLKTIVAKPVTNIIHKPTPITYIGPGKLNAIMDILKMNNSKKAFFIVSNTIMKKGIVDKLIGDIKNQGIEVKVFAGVKPDPTFKTVIEAQKLCEDADIMVAIGGGSILDTAKAVSAAVTNHIDPHKLTGLLKVKGQPLPLIAVPTTAGTGSETTVAAVISDTESHIKKQILDPKIVPLYAILDPELMKGLPSFITATTTMDALTHALEAYVSKYATEETDRYAEIAVKLIFENFDSVMKSSEDLKAREMMLIASFYAGMAFTRTYVGYVHAFSHAIGGKFGVSHGLGNAVILPHVMNYYKDVCEKKFSKLSDIVNLSRKDEDTKENADRFIESIFKMNKKVGIPDRLEAFPKGNIDEIIVMAFRECHGTYPVPKYFSKNQARKLLEKVAN